MQQAISKTRLAIVLIVTLVSILCAIPTVRYNLHLRQRPAEVGGPRPSSATPPPPKSQKIQYAEWEKQNPAPAKWLSQNTVCVIWEDKAERLRKSAIPLGLDLIGGVDVTLALDRGQAYKNEVTRFADNVRNDILKSKYSAEVNPADEGRALTVRLTAAGDARNVANLLKNYEHVIAQVPTEAQLAPGKPVKITLDEKSLEDKLVQDVEGARKGIADRVDQLGVTQPRISIQGKDRIRVQVPGEKDPDRLINTVIKPAALEFRLVSEKNDQVIGSDGKVKPGVAIPLGTEIKDAKDGKLDPTTGVMKYTEKKILLQKTIELTGKNLRSAGVSYNPGKLDNPIVVTLEFDNEGRRKFAQLTTDNVGRGLAIVLDGIVRSHPNLKEPILDGRAEISGGFTNEEATDLSRILKAGSLKAPLKIEAKRTVGATLGADSIKSGIDALLWGSVIITVFMIVYYGTAGAIAVVALILNILIILAIMALSQATLTLSGIGGILLTIGMAVDANVLIYERIREEVAAGRPLRQAIGLGFSRAFSVILDSNLTTLLSALVLLQFTEGSVFGFALTMTFGLLANLFTGLTVTFTLCGLWFAWRGSLSLGKLTIFRNAAFDFIGARWFSWTFSNVVLIGSIILVFTLKGGPQMGVDFAGGSRSEVYFNPQVQKVDTQKIRSALEDKAVGLQEPNVQAVLDTPNLYIIDVRLSGDLQATEKKMDEVLGKHFPGGYEIRMQSGFGAQTSQEFQWLALTVTVLASLAILIYLWFRFELVFGVAAVVALLHDLLIVFFVASLWNVQVSLDVVAALMVLMGFSVNDTIVIFDRIRENTRIMHGKGFGEICNLAMNQSLSRTLITSGTVFMAVLALYLVGGEGLRPFAKVYLLGTIFGTYSSDFIAAPIVYQWNKYRGNKIQRDLAAKKKKKELAKPIRSAGAATRPTA